jgi:hypothetical protein
LEFLANLIIGLGGVFWAQALTPSARPDSPPGQTTASKSEKPAPADRPPWFIILSNPKDLEALWQSIDHPDLVIQRATPVGPREDAERRDAQHADFKQWLVESVRVRGLLADEYADLTIELAIRIKGSESVWVPIRLDDQNLTTAREGVRELSLRRAERSQWQVKLAGEGEHHVQVELKVPLSADRERRSLSLAIPEAQSTSLALDIARGATDIVVGSNEQFGLKDLADQGRQRLTTYVSPRSKLDLSWARRSDSGVDSTPLMTVQGEIEVDVDQQQLGTRSSWTVGVVRGATRSLEMRFDDQDDLTELRLDDQPVEGRIDRTPGAATLTIPLRDLLRPGATKRVVMKTRRSFSSSASKRLSFSGFPLKYAREQSGQIGISARANLWVSAAASQGLRRIAPGELPTYLRARPATSLAFEFLEQPFRLELLVEPAPPLVRATSRAVFQIEREQIRSETTVALQWTTGRLFEVELDVAAGLEIVSVGPRDLVETSHLTFDQGGDNAQESDKHNGRLRVRLASPGRDQNQTRLRIVALQRVSADGLVKLALVTPRGTTAPTAYYAFFPERGLTVELPDDSGPFRRVGAESAASAFNLDGEWPGPAWRAATGSAPLLLAGDGRAESLPIRLIRHARALGHDTVLSAQVKRRGIDLVQRSTVSVRHGSLTSIELAVPAALVDRWEVLDKELVERQELGPEPGGGRRYRLSFERPVLDKVTLRLRAHLPLQPGLDSKTARAVSLPMISIKEGVAAATKVELSVTPEIAIDTTSPEWVRLTDESRSEFAGEGSMVQYIPSEPRGQTPVFSFKARALDAIPLPSLVVARLLVRSILGNDNTVTSTAFLWIDSHGPDLPFSLPDGARWLGARVDGRAADGLDDDQSRSSYRLRFPGDVGSKPVLVELKYQQGGPGGAAHAWQVPRVLDGGVVLQSLWEVRLPWNLALLGVPAGWSDENDWHWDRYAWKRAAWKSAPSLNDWLAGTGASPAAIDDLARENIDESDRYLFSRAGPPVPIGPWIVSHAWLVAACSGAAFFVGFVAIFSRVRFRALWLGASVVALLASVLVQPSVVLVAIQSALLGVVLTMMGLVLDRLMERARWTKAPRRQANHPSGRRAISDSSLQRSKGVGSEEPTEIRVRVPSTVDYAPAPFAIGPVEGQPRGSAEELQ